MSGTVMGGAVSVASTGPVSVTGGAQEAAALEQSVSGGLSVGSAHAAVIARGSGTPSEAAAGNVSVNGCGGLFWAATTITADFLLPHGKAARCRQGDCSGGEV